MGPRTHLIFRPVALWCAIWKILVQETVGLQLIPEPRRGVLWAGLAKRRPDELCGVVPSAGLSFSHISRPQLHVAVTRCRPERSTFFYYVDLQSLGRTDSRHITR